MSTSLGVIQRLVGGGSSEQSCFKNSVESHWYWRNLSLLFSFFLNNFIYLFRPSGPLLLPGLFSSCCAEGCSLVEELGLSGMRALVVEACGFTGCYSQLQSVGHGSAVVVHWLSCSAACGIFPERSNLCLLQWQVDSLPLSHQGSARLALFSFPSPFSFPRLTLRKVVSLVL